MNQEVRFRDIGRLAGLDQESKRFKDGKIALFLSNIFRVNIFEILASGDRIVGGFVLDAGEKTADQLELEKAIMRTAEAMEGTILFFCDPNRTQTPSELFSFVRFQVYEAIGKIEEWMNGLAVAETEFGGKEDLLTDVREHVRTLLKFVSHVERAEKILEENPLIGTTRELRGHLFPVREFVSRILNFLQQMRWSVASGDNL